jgi:DNA-nicking Smr family endonuclease
MPTKSSAWEAYKRLVSPVAKKKKARPKPKAASTACARDQAQREPPRLPSTHCPPLPSSVVHPLERKREKSLRQGEIDIEAKLDLHGKTQVEAFEALWAFVARKTREGKRHLLIVTGKGNGSTGTLRRNLKDWLAQLPEAPLMLALREAAPKHGGEGAFYLVMRKKRG